MYIYATPFFKIKKYTFLFSLNKIMWYHSIALYRNSTHSFPQYIFTAGQGVNLYVILLDNAKIASIGNCTNVHSHNNI